jgi:hypothetical protein
MIVTKTDHRTIAFESLKTASVISGMVVLPFLVHLIPYSGKAPLGATLLPMFIVPLVGAFFVSPVGLVVAALAAPLLNYLLTGMPALPNLYVVTTELLLFSMAVSWLARRGWRFAGFSVLTFVAAKLAVYLPAVLIYGQRVSLEHFGSYLVGLKVALPGMLVLLLVERMLTSKKA